MTFRHLLPSIEAKKRKPLYIIALVGALVIVKFQRLAFLHYFQLISGSKTETH